MQAKRIVLIGAYCAVLIGGQLALSGIAGVEVVTVMLAAFAFAFGRADGVILAIAFSLLRCVLFGFFPNVVILYFVYYPALAFCFGWFGKKCDKKVTVKTHAVAVFLALVFGALFTALDNVITPLYYGYSKKLTQIYHAASIPVLISQTVCAVFTVLFLFPPLVKILNRFTAQRKRREVNEQP